jgi:hypothetical protein
MIDPNIRRIFEENGFGFRYGCLDCGAARATWCECFLREAVRKAREERLQRWRETRAAHAAGSGR